MRISISKANLLRALKTVKPVVDIRSSISILQTVRLSARETSLVVTGDNLQCRAQSAVNACVNDSGDVCVGFDVLFRLANASSANVPIEIESVDSGINVTSGRTTTNMPTLNVDGFPEVSQSETQYTANLRASDLLREIDRVSICIERASLSQSIIGLSIKPCDSGLELCGARGSWISYTRIDCDSHGFLPIQIHNENLSALKVFLSSRECDVQIEGNESEIYFRSSGDVLRIVTTDTPFIDYHRITPRTHARNFIVNREDLLHCLDQLLIVSGGSESGIIFDCANGEIVLTPYTRLDTFMQTSVPSPDCPSAYFAMNGKQLKDCLSSTDGDTVTISEFDSGSRFTVRGISDGHLTILGGLRARRPMEESA